MGIDNRDTYYYKHFDETGLNIIFNNGSAQTADITDCTKAGNYYYSWDGGSGYSLIKYEEGIIQSSSPHIGKRGHFNESLFRVF